MRRLSVFAGLLLLCSPAAPAQAQDEDAALEPFRACGEITAGDARLACFDQALAQSATLQAERAERRRRRTIADFGLSATQIEEREDRRQRDSVEIAGATAEQAEPDEITSPVADVLTDMTQRRVIILENGQIWREVTNSTLRGRIRIGKIATVSRARLGAYHMRIEDRVGFLNVRRER